MFEKLIKDIERMQNMRVSVPIKADEEGYLDKECPSEECMYQFKVLEEDWKGRNEPAFCPMCGQEANGDSFWTTEQIKHAQRQALNQFKNKFDNALRASAVDFNRKYSQKGFISMKMEYRGTGAPSFILPSPAKRELEQKINCSQCNARYSVLGSAFFCPCCGHNSANETFDNSIKKIEAKIANLETIRKAVSEISEDDAENTVRSLIESGLSDGVVAFQRFCEVTYKNHKKDEEKIKSNAFQNLGIGEVYWKTLLDESYSDWLTKAEMKSLNILFQKRHLLAHAEGIVDEKYLDKSEDKKYKVGQRIVVKKEDVLTIVNLIKKLVENIRTKLDSKS